MQNVERVTPSGVLYTLYDLVDTTEPWYESQGRPKLVLLPGTGNRASEVFETLLPFLLDWADVMLVEMRGFGSSGWNLSIESMAEDVISCCDQVGWEGFHILGFSMGGFVAVAVATSHRARVSSIIMMSSGMTFDSLDIVSSSFIDQSSVPLCTSPFLDRTIDCILLSHYSDKQLGLSAPASKFMRLLGLIDGYGSIVYLCVILFRIKKRSKALYQLVKMYVLRYGLWKVIYILFFRNNPHYQKLRNLWRTYVPFAAGGYKTIIPSAFQAVALIRYHAAVNWITGLSEVLKILTGCPSLHLSGTEDGIVPHRCSLRFYNNMLDVNPTSTFFHALPGMRHGAIASSDGAEIVSKRIQKFISLHKDKYI